MLNFVDLDNCYESGWMEQERGTCCRTGSQASAKVYTSLCFLHLYTTFWNSTYAQNSRVLLRKHEFYEDLPENNTTFL